MRFALSPMHIGFVNGLARFLAEPWPWDIGAQLQGMMYAALRFLTSAIFALDDALLGAARGALMLRNTVTQAGPVLLGNLFHEISPLWTVGLFAILMAAIIWMASRFVISSQVTTAERFVLVTLLAGYLMVNGRYAVEWTEFMRYELGHLVYGVAYASMQETLPPPPPGGGNVVPNCALSRDDPDTTLCTGYEFALSYLQFTSEDEVFLFGMPDAFTANYFSVPNAEFAGKPEAERNRLLERAQAGPLQALGGIFLAIMAILEELVRFLLTIALLAAFTGLAVALIVGAFLPLGQMFTNIVQQIAQLFISTAVIEMLMGVLSGLLWGMQGNGVMFLSAGVLMLLAYVVLLSQTGALVLRSLDGAMHGAVRMGAPEMLRAGGLEQLGRATGAVHDALAGGGRQPAEANPGTQVAGHAPGVAAAEAAMNGVPPGAAAPGSAAAPSSAAGAPGAAGSTPTSAGAASSPSGSTAAGGNWGAPQTTSASTNGTAAQTAAGQSGAGATSAATATGGTGSSSAASPADGGAPSAPAAAPVAPVYGPETGRVYDPGSGRSMPLAEYSAGGAEELTGTQAFAPAPLPASDPEFYSPDEDRAAWARLTQLKKEDWYEPVDA